MNPLTYKQAISEHYAGIWSNPIDLLRWDRGPTHELSPEFDVHVYRSAVDMLAFATLNMSDFDDANCLELHAHCRPEDRQHSNLLEILSAVAHFHRTGVKLALGHSVNFGKPWVSGSTCTYGILSLPYLDGPALEWCEMPRIQFLWLIPVTESEVEYKKKFGMEALEQELELHQFNYLDPFRKAVV